MTIEQKAKAYDEAINRASGFKTQEIRDIVEHIFPELRESEDERIRKGIIIYLEQSQFGEEHYCIDDDIVRDYISWLEKQGEHQKFIDAIQIDDRVTRNKNDVLVNLSQLDRVVKLADEVEPKFHKDEWITCCDYEPVQIISITGNMYEMLNGDNRPFNIVDNNHNIRLWSIKDAKDGDVLRIKNLTFIFQEITNNNACHKEAVVAYCSYEDNDDGFGVCGPDCITDLEIITPATKEQRDTLFAKMKEAGYEWNAEKKELKEIEKESEISFGAYDSELQEDTYFIPKGFHAEINDDKVVIKKGEKHNAWSEEDEEMVEGLNNCINELEEVNGWNYVYSNNKNIKISKVRRWIKFLKDRIGCEANCITTKEWSEEDEQIILSIEQVMNCASLLNIVPEKMVKIKTWLKSLKGKVQTQSKQWWGDEDEKICQETIDWFEKKCFPYALESENPARESIKWLKSLKEKYTWKPSDEQIEALESATENCAYSEYQDCLRELIGQLKKLRENKV